MTSASLHDGRNRLIDALPGRQRSSFLERSQAVHLDIGEVLCEPDQRFRHVYFPLAGYVSLRRLMDGGRSLEVELVGNEGMLGATLALGVNTAHLRGIVHRAGPALRMSAGRFQAQLSRSPALSRGVNAYLHQTVDQLSQTAGCIHYHEVGQRLARWLLMTHDQSRAGGLHLTHQSLAEVLGVQRSAVTIAAGALRRKGIIAYSRGRLSVLDRSALESASCDCFTSPAKPPSRPREN